MPGEDLAVKEVAALFKLMEKTVYSLRGEIPASKVRGEWRITSAELNGGSASSKGES